MSCSCREQNAPKIKIEVLSRSHSTNVGCFCGFFITSCYRHTIAATAVADAVETSLIDE